MHFVIDGGSMINQVPDLFDEGEGLLPSLWRFIRRYSDAFAMLGHNITLVFRGNEFTESPARIRQGPFTVVFSRLPEDEEAMLFEAARSKRFGGETFLVTDNRGRQERASYNDIKAMGCARFSEWMFKALANSPKSGSGDGPAPDVKFWANVFGVSLDSRIDLTAESRKLHPSGENDDDENEPG
ncbi:MAG: hypothetical protein WC712_10640 [Candidatus Brocadiia bacterium]